MAKVTHFFAERGSPQPLPTEPPRSSTSVLKQSTLLAYIDDFRLMAYLSLICLPFLLLFRHRSKRKSQWLQRCNRRGRKST
jgi:hypothetical protein